MYVNSSPSLPGIISGRCIHIMILFLSRLYANVSQCKFLSQKTVIQEIFFPIELTIKILIEKLLTPYSKELKKV